MKLTEDFWEFAVQSLRLQEQLILMFVVEASAGSPGRRGFKLALSSSGKLNGTIGGGIMEMNLIKRANEMLAEGASTPVLIPQIHRKNEPKHPSGLICAGSQTVVLCPCNRDILTGIESVSIAKQKRKDMYLRLDEKGFKFEDGHYPACNEAFEKRSKEEWLYRENINPTDHVYVIGGGHVGLALCRILSTLNLHVTVFDHRTKLHTIEQNHYADKCVHTPYANLLKHIQEGDNSFVVVVTTSLINDLEALNVLAKKRFRFLGAMGSKAKISKITKELRKTGVNEEQINTIHAPIGLAIVSHTAEEIAISIAAQIIQIKNK
jgi:xanthine dehydrogenase accessory factor